MRTRPRCCRRSAPSKPRTARAGIGRRRAKLSLSRARASRGKLISARFSSPYAKLPVFVKFVIYFGEGGCWGGLRFNQPPDAEAPFEFAQQGRAYLHRRGPNRGFS
jgi:hypothetical protein